MKLTALSALLDQVEMSECVDEAWFLETYGRHAIDCPYGHEKAFKERVIALASTTEAAGPDGVYSSDRSDSAASAAEARHERLLHGEAL